MENSQFQQLSKSVYDRVFQVLDALDPDEVEADASADNIKITFANRVQFVLNRQTAVFQIWLATKARGYHFNYDEQKNAWICDHTGEELFSLLSKEVSEQAKKSIQF